MTVNTKETQQKSWLGNLWTGLKQAYQKVLDFFSPKKTEPSPAPKIKSTIDREALRRQLKEQMYDDQFRREYPHHARLRDTLKERKKILHKYDQVLAKQDEVLAETKEIIVEMKKILHKYDQVLAKQDEVLAKQDEVLAKQDEVLAKQDEVLAERREILGSLRNQQQELIAEQTRLTIKNLLQRFTSAPSPSKTHHAARAA